MKIFQAVALFSFVQFWGAQGIVIADAGKQDNEPEDEIPRLRHRRHKTRMLNARYQGNDDSDAESATSFALDRARAEQRRQRDIGHAATCANPLTMHMPEIVRLECDDFMKDLCKVGRDEAVVLEEVKDYCTNFYGDGKAVDNTYKAEEMPSDYSPPPMPWSNKKEEQPLPEQGYWGKKVEHDDMQTHTGDWQMEFGPKQHGEQNVQQICKRYPNSEWCRIYAHRYGPAYGYAGAARASRSRGRATLYDSSSSSSFAGSDPVDPRSDSSDDDASLNSGTSASSGGSWSILGSFWKLVGYK